jgi:hypothetical protein
MPDADFITYQKGAYYARIKAIHTLPSNVTSLNHCAEVFKAALKYYPLFHSFSVEEFF